VCLSLKPNPLKTQANMDAQTTPTTPSIKKKTTKPQQEQEQQAQAAAAPTPPTAAGNDPRLALLTSQTSAATARLAAAKRELADLSASHTALLQRLTRARTEAARACRCAVAMAAGAPKGGQALVESARELESARAAYVERWRNLEWLSHRLRVAQEGLTAGLGVGLLGSDGRSSSSSEDEEDDEASDEGGEDDDEGGGGF
jgi:hypothetical protein